MVSLLTNCMIFGFLRNVCVWMERLYTRALGAVWGVNPKILFDEPYYRL
jgi:hypothetical protein